MTSFIHINLKIQHENGFNSRIVHNSEQAHINYWNIILHQDIADQQITFTKNIHMNEN